MNDLSKLPDRELDALFSTEVAGWRFQKVAQLWYDSNGRWIPPRDGVKFSTSLDALMPFVEEVRKADGWLLEWLGDAEDWHVSILWCGDRKGRSNSEARSTSLPRAVAEALILWKRAQKGVA